MSNFKVWVDDANVTNNTTSTFLQPSSDDNERIKGFQAGTAASAKFANTALRQANLVATALMEQVVGNDTTLNYGSSVLDVKNAINTYLTQNLTVANAINAINNEDNTFSKIEKNSSNVIYSGNNKFNTYETTSYTSKSFTFTSAQSYTVLTDIPLVTNIRCYYSIGITNEGSSSGYIDFYAKYAINNGQIFEINVPVSDDRQSWVKFALVIYMIQGTSSCVAKLIKTNSGTATTTRDASITLSNFLKIN